MHEMLCFAGQNVPWMMDGEGLSRDGFGTVRNGLGYARIMVGSARSGTDSSGVVLRNLNFQNLKDVSHESFVFTSSAFRF